MPIPMTIDDALRPMTMTCANCGNVMIVYPCPMPEGTGVCPTCSPSWLESFAKFMMNEERKRRKLNPLA